MPITLSPVETRDELPVDIKWRFPERGRIFLVAPEDKRLNLAKRIMKGIFEPKFEIVTASDLSSFENLLEGICERIYKSSFVIIIYAMCSSHSQTGTLRLPRANIPFELGICLGAGVPFVFFHDADIKREDMEREFSDIKGQWFKSVNLRSKVSIRGKLKSEYEKLKPRLIERLVDQYTPPDTRNVPEAKLRRARASLKRLAEEMIDLDT